MTRGAAVGVHRAIATCAGLALLMGGCSAAQPPREGAPRAADEHAAPGPAGPVCLGFRFGASRDEVLAAHPGLVVAPDGTSAEAALDVGGVAVPLQLSLHRGRLYAVSFRLGGAEATIDAYRAIVAHLEAGLGDGASTRCESEDGVAFEPFVASGQGALRTDWRDAEIVGHVSLSRSYAPAAPFEIRGSATAPRLAPPCDVEEFVCGEAEKGEPAGPEEARPSGGCEVDLSAEQPASVMGLAFGSTRDQVEAALGRTLAPDPWWGAALPWEIEGATGALRLAFYDGCLAVLVFQSDDGVATLEAYRALQTWARGGLGPGSAFRCVSEEGVPDPQHVAAGHGSFHTRWRDDDGIEAALRLEAIDGPREAPRIVLEVSYLPLRSHAPRIDF